MHDYHLHSHFCRHAEGSLEEYARQALRMGMGEICFTPHLPMDGFRPEIGKDDLRMHEDEFPRYLEELERTRALFPDLVILSGIEADYVEGREEKLSRFLSAHPFDFVLMSVHSVAKWPAGQWVFDFKGDSRPLERIYDDYLEAVLHGVETGLFDCVAHLDLIKQKGRPLLEAHRERVEAIVAECLVRGMSAEINTSGTRKAVGERYPSDDIVRLMKDRGLPLVIDSDAHKPSQVGWGFGELAGIQPVRYRQRRIVAG